MDVACVLFGRVLDQKGRVDSSYLFNRLLTTHTISFGYLRFQKSLVGWMLKWRGGRVNNPIFPSTLYSLIYTDLQSMSPSAGTEWPSCMQTNQNLGCSQISVLELICIYKRSPWWLLSVACLKWFADPSLHELAPLVELQGYLQAECLWNKVIKWKAFNMNVQLLCPEHRWVLISLLIFNGNEYLSKKNNF